MDLPRPKPIHSLRSFLSEVGIIVLGVLIALAAEQGVQALNWRHKVSAVIEQMRNELTTDDGPQAYWVLATHDCRAQRLDQIDSLIARGGDRRELRSLANAYGVAPLTWDSQGWQAASTGDMAGHISAQELSSWYGPYAMVAELQHLQQKERDDVSALRTLRDAPGRLSDTELEAVGRATQQLRDDNDTLATYATLVFTFLPKGVSPSPQYTRLAEDAARRDYGACVRPLSTVRPGFPIYPADLRKVQPRYLAPARLVPQAAAVANPIGSTSAR